ncbi:hypothetical protein COB21_00185 [Candidatus Aerophobetes bacterium]|uniref:DNA polymerase III subunit chi n=1 Tax=Aerophobetes bacterium TaxID=2030807 RepID=A0A2A4X8W2_UNCAE|nr:MAG: hypothetical protein COB21_00185 [Candidatus Aerophobetes bacterium]
MTPRTSQMSPRVKKANSKKIYVTFFKVANAREKQVKIFEIAHHYFTKGQALLFFSKNPVALDYTSLLLWSYSKNDFLPHTKDLENCDNLLYLGQTAPKRETHAAFNLEPSPIDLESVTTIYEFDDSSTAEKASFAKKRYSYYLEKGCAIQLQ